MKKLTALFRRRKAIRVDDDYDRTEDERLKGEFTGSYARTRDYLGIGLRGGKDRER